MVSKAGLRTSVEEEEEVLRMLVEEEVLEETRVGAPLLRVSSGETGDREGFLIQAGHHLQPGDFISNNNHSRNSNKWP